MGSRITLGLEGGLENGKGRTGMVKGIICLESPYVLVGVLTKD